MTSPEPIRQHRIVNLTPHPVRLYVGDRVVATWPPTAGPMARVPDVVVRTDLIHTDQGGVPVSDIRPLRQVRGLPDPEPRTLFIVSRVAAMATSRADVIFPFDEHRDEEGRVDGCRALARWRRDDEDA